MASRPLPVSQLRARRRKRRILILIGIFMLCVVLVAGAAGLSWLPQMRIVAVEVAGVESVAEDAVIKEAQSKLAGAYAFVLARNNVLIYPKENIRARIAEVFPVFNKVEVSATNFTTLKIEVTERKPRGLWCGESIIISSPCYLLDETGLAYTPAADFSGTVYTRYYGTAEGTVPKQYLTPELFISLAALMEEIKTRGVAGAIAGVEVRAEGAVYVSFTNGFALIFMLINSGADVLERLGLALTAEPFTSHTLADFEYLDLRFGDKLYYKMK